MFDKFAMADRKKEALEKQVFESISNMENPSQTNCSNGKNLQMKPDAMNHIDQWSSGGEGSINTDPNSIKVFIILFTEGILSNAHGCFQGWGWYPDEYGHQRGNQRGYSGSSNDILNPVLFLCFQKVSFPSIYLFRSQRQVGMIRRQLKIPNYVFFSSVSRAFFSYQ